MWSQVPLRLCMAAMAPALTDASAHTGSFKLPTSPANPGSSGLQVSPSQPNSPDLPSLANGHSPGVPGPGSSPGIRNDCSIRSKHSCSILLKGDNSLTTSPYYTIHRSNCFLENNNHKKREVNCVAADEIDGDFLHRNINSKSDHNEDSVLKSKLNSFVSTIGNRLGSFVNGEEKTTRPIRPESETMNNTPVSLAQKEESNDSRTKSLESTISKMAPLTISSAGSVCSTSLQHSIAGGIEVSVSIRDNGNVSDLDTSDSSSSSDSMSNDIDSSLNLSTPLTTDTSIEHVVEESHEPEVKSDDESDSGESEDEQHVNIPSVSEGGTSKHKESCDKNANRRTQLHVTPSILRHFRKFGSSVSTRKEKINYRVVENDNDSNHSTKEDLAKSAKVVHKHSKLDHRAKYLVEKLRRLQTCHVGSHIYQQMGSFVESKQPFKDGTINASAANNGNGCEECRKNRLTVGARPNPISRINLNTSNQTCVLHSASSSSSDRQRHSARPPSWLPTGKRTKSSTHISQHLREGKAVYREVKSVTGRLQASLRHVESTIDSDVTDSSSGGESCDEGDDSLPQSQSSRSFSKMPLHRRASWKWAMDRAAIASRWTWLQAQVSDLEYRIRQQSDIFKQIRATKGSVALGEPPSPEDYLRAQQALARTGRKLSPLEAKIVMLEGPNSLSPSNITSLLTNVDNQSAKLKHSLQNCISPLSSSPSTSSDSRTSPTRPLNGLTDSAKTPSPGGVTCNQVASSPLPIEEQYCARTRPVRPFRKRKLIRSSGLYQVCRKAQKLSSVKCGCFPPHTPCVMCGGRLNNVEQFDADQFPMPERVASLEYAFHSVLSFPEEIPLSVHFEALLKSGTWQKKHVSRSLGKKKHNKLSNKARIKIHGKDSRLKKFRKKDKHRQQKRRAIGGGSERGAVKKSASGTKKEPKAPKVPKEPKEPKEVKEAKPMLLESKVEEVVPPLATVAQQQEAAGSGQEEEEDAARSRKLLHKLARQKLKALRQVRSEKLLSRSRSQPSSVPGTPKNPMKTSELRQCRTEIKQRRSVDLLNALKSRERSLSLPNIEVGDGAAATASAPASGSNSPTQMLSHSLPSGGLQTTVPNKKGIVEAYDIDNIVIPYSMLASTRVQRLNYKEIATPKWRELEPDEYIPSLNHGESEGPQAPAEEKEMEMEKEKEMEMEMEKEKEEEEDVEENLSDSEFLQRHGLCESVEKQKFLASVVDHGIPGRRSRRSRNSSLGSSFDAQSPDFQIDHLSMGMHSESPSPSPVTTPDHLAASASSSSLNVSGNRSLRFSALNRRRSSSMSDAQPSVQPCEDSSSSITTTTACLWMRRQFPLTNSEIEEIAVYPYPESEASTRPSSRASNVTHPESVGSRMETQDVNFYISDGENSDPEPMEVDDPNDPEWTVVEDQQRSRKLEGSGLSEGLVLKLAKR